MSTIEAGRETDARIGRDVMGLPITGALREVYYEAARGVRMRVPRFSEDISAAWDVVEALDAAGLYTEVHNNHNHPAGYFAHVYGDGYEPQGMAHAPTAPLAIVRAALSPEVLEHLRKAREGAER